VVIYSCGYFNLGAAVCTDLKIQKQRCKQIVSTKNEAYYTDSNANLIYFVIFHPNEINKLFAKVELLSFVRATPGNQWKEHARLA
jgi:hypothetical protein